jgi:uncharacterized protein YabN with tetrapyrrole methylase and pyrophosphatase domain
MIYKQLSHLNNLLTNASTLKGSIALQEQAAKIGFDWKDPQGPLEKVFEEAEEVSEELNVPEICKERLEEELGDLLFAVVNLMRKCEVDPEVALQRCAEKFNQRITKIIKLTSDSEIDFNTLTQKELIELWEKVKETP